MTAGLGPPRLVCPRCGYDLAGVGLGLEHPDAVVSCPECGRRVDLNGALLRWRLEHLGKGQWWTGTGSIQGREWILVAAVFLAILLLVVAVGMAGLLLMS